MLDNIESSGRLALYALAISIVTSGSPALAQCELQKVLASDGANFDSFGAAAALERDILRRRACPEPSWTPAPTASDAASTTSESR